MLYRPYPLFLTLFRNRKANRISQTLLTERSTLDRRDWKPKSLSFQVTRKRFTQIFPDTLKFSVNLRKKTAQQLVCLPLRPLVLVSGRSPVFLFYTWQQETHISRNFNGELPYYYLLCTVKKKVMTGFLCRHFFPLIHFLIFSPDWTAKEVPLFLCCFFCWK